MRGGPIVRPALTKYDDRYFLIVFGLTVAHGILLSNFIIGLPTIRSHPFLSKRGGQEDLSG